MLTGARWAGLTVMLIALVLMTGACGFGLGGDDGPAVVVYGEVGDDPFVDDVAVAPPSDLIDLQDEVAAAADQVASVGQLVSGVDVVGGAASNQVDDSAAVSLTQISLERTAAAVEVAREAGLPVIEPASPAGVGLYGGTGVNSCDSESLISFLEQNGDEAAAFAGVHGIDVNEIRSFVESLTSGFLLVDTPVVNHSFSDGAARPFDAVLEAGTAVLVDGDGIPRVRCKCGNPLLPQVVVVDGEAFNARSFADEVVDAAIDPAVADAYRDPEMAIGPPGCGSSTDCSEGEVALGSATQTCQFYVTLRFVDNTLENGPGPDLRVVEIGAIEPTEVSVLIDDELVPVGVIDGGDSTIDLSPALEEGTVVDTVQICDVPNDDPGTVPGADIDAVAALHWSPR